MIYLERVNIRLFTQLFSLRDLRSAVLGSVVVLGGIGLSLLTLYAHRSGDARLAGISAAASLVFVLLILIFVVPPLARNAGREASQMDLPFDLTLGGAIMLGLIAIVGFSAWNTGNNLLFLILSFLAASMIVGFFAGSACLKKIDVRMRFPETIFAGEETPILVTLHNRKRILPTFSVVAEVRGQERERSAVLDELQTLIPRRLAERFARPPVVRRTLDYFVHVPRNSVVENKINHTFARRGRFLIKDFELTTRFPFGFYRHRRRLPAKEAELVVFPALLPIDIGAADLTLDAGQMSVSKRGLGQDLLALRDYEPNDDLRRIDWKATARTRQLTVREFSAEDERRATIIFDTRLPADDNAPISLRARIKAEQNMGGMYYSKRFERGVSSAASLISHFITEKALVRLIIDGDAGEFGSGRQHLYECLKRFALVEPSFELPGQSFDEPRGPFRPGLEDAISTPDAGHIFIFASAPAAVPPEFAQVGKVIGF